MSGVRGASALAAIKHASVRDGSGLLSASRVRVRDATGLKIVFSAMAAGASPGLARGFGNSSSTVTIITPVVTATIIGGVAPFTYLWTRTDADPQAWTITNPTGSGTAFSSDVDAGGNVTATFICTVTDSTGATASTGEVEARAINLGGGL